MATRETAVAALRIHGESLSRVPGVIAVGIGRADSSESDSTEDEVGIIVYFAGAVGSQDSDSGGEIPALVETPGWPEPKNVKVTRSIVTTGREEGEVES